MPITNLQLQTLARDAMQRFQACDFAGAEPLLTEVAAAQLTLGHFVEPREPLEGATNFLPKEIADQINSARRLTVPAEHKGSLWAYHRVAISKPGERVIAPNRGRTLEAPGRVEEVERTHDDALRPCGLRRNGPSLGYPALGLTFA